MIEKILKKAITDFKLELANVDANIKFMEAARVPIREDLQGAILELQKVCKHEKARKVEGTYIPSGYDYVSEQAYTTLCDNCGKVLESKCIRGTTFG